jgi:glycosyltransferase involved in cell wall biosynthesis
VTSMQWHICHINTTFNLQSGSARRTRAILEGARREGYKISLIVGKDHDIPEQGLSGVDIYHIPELLKYIHPIQDIKALFSLYRILRRLRPDLVHTHLAKGGVLGRMAAFLAQTPRVVHTIHGPTFPPQISWPRRLLFRGLERFCGRWTDRMVFVGQELQESYVEAGVCAPNRTEVIRTGRPQECFTRQKLSREGKARLRKELCQGRRCEVLLVAVGRVVPTKQFDHCIILLGMLRRAGIDARLGIVGKSLLIEEQGHERYLYTVAKNNDVVEYTHFVGFREDILDIMEAADVVLLTSKYEGLPNVAVESFIVGTPMLSYKVSGVDEILKYDRRSMIVPGNDIDMAFSGLLKLINNMNIDNYNNDDRYNILKEYNVSYMVKMKLNLYHRLLM